MSLPLHSISEAAAWAGDIFQGDVCTPEVTSLIQTFWFNKIIMTSATMIKRKKILWCENWISAPATYVNKDQNLWSDYIAVTWTNSEKKTQVVCLE